MFKSKVNNFDEIALSDSRMVKPKKMNNDFFGLFDANFKRIKKNTLDKLGLLENNSKKAFYPNLKNFAFLIPRLRNRKLMLLINSV